MCICNIYTIFGVSLVVLGWSNKIDSGSKVFWVFFKCINAVEQMFRTVWNIPSSHPTIPFTLSHLEGTMSRMSSLHTKNKINVSASFVDSLNWSLFVQQKATMWVVIIGCVVTLTMWIWKEDRSKNVIYIEQIVSGGQSGHGPPQAQINFFPHSACCINVTSHLLPLSTVSSNIVLLNQT